MAKEGQSFLNVLLAENDEGTKDIDAKVKYQVNAQEPQMTLTRASRASHFQISGLD